MLKKAFYIILFFYTSLLVGQKLEDFNRKIFGKTMEQIGVITGMDAGDYFIDDLLFDLVSGDTMDMRELAFAYYGFALLPDYNPQKYIGLELQVMQLNDNFETEKALRFADSLVTQYPTCLMGYVELSYAYNRLQDTLKAGKYRQIYEDLTSMILKTGDGKSYETAYVITGIKDIEVITQIERMQLLSRKTVKKKKKTYEVVTVFRNYKKEKIIFDTTILSQLGGVN